MGLRNLSIVFLLLAGILIFAACGGSTTLLDDPDALADTAMPAVTEASGESMSGIPGIPLDSPDDAAAHTASSVPAGLGQDYIMMNGGYLDGTALVLENHPEYDPDSDTDPPLELSYAMYKASGLEGMRPESLNIECIPGGLGQGYFVGIADYTTANWQWFGPVGFPEFELDLTEHTHQFVTNLGNMYFIIVVPPGNSATHYQYSVLSGPSDPGTQPGLPHHLVASDGQFPEQVRLSWLGGTGAAQYQIFRRAAQDEDCEDRKSVV